MLELSLAISLIGSYAFAAFLIDRFKIPVTPMIADETNARIASIENKISSLQIAIQMKSRGKSFGSGD